MEFATDKFLALASQKVAVLVDDGNFLAWKQHVLLIVKTHRLQMFLERTVSIPPRMIVNDEGPTLYNQLVGSSGSSCELWQALMCIFGSHSTTKAMRCGQCVTMEEQQSAILNGLPPKFDHVVSIIITSRVSFDLQGITTALWMLRLGNKGISPRRCFQQMLQQCTRMFRFQVFRHIPVNLHRICFVHRVDYRVLIVVEVVASRYDSTSDGEGKNSSFRDNTESWARSSHMGRKPIQAYMCYTNDGLHSSYYAHNPPICEPLRQIQPTCNEIDSTQRGQSSHFHMPAVIGQISRESSGSGSDFPSTVVDPIWYPDSGATAHMTNDSAKLSDVRLYNGGALPESFQQQGSDVQFDRWHRRLGHPSWDVVRSILTSCNIRILTRKNYTLCNACELGKGHKLPFRPSDCVYTAPLELVVADLQTDGSGEFRSFDVYLKQCRIGHRVSCPHTSEQNGLVERRHRQIVETRLVLLAQASLPISYWADIISSLESLSVFTIRFFGHIIVTSFNTGLLLVPSWVMPQITGDINVLIDMDVFIFLVMFGLMKLLIHLFAQLSKSVVSVPDSRSGQFMRDVTSLPIFMTSPANISESSSVDSTPASNSSPVDTSLMDPISSNSEGRLAPIVEQQGSSLINRHPMMTRSKIGIYKPKTYMAVVSDVEPSTIHEAMAIPSWKQAVNDELQALTRNRTWDLVSVPANQYLVGCKWLFKIKKNSDGSVARNKVRLVAQRFFQAAGLDYHETFSPVVKVNTVRLILALAVSRKWKLQQVDVNNAFLNGDLVEDIYMKQPPGFEVVDEHDAGSVYFLVYVDDIIVTGGDCDEIYAVISCLDRQFSLKDLGELSFFLGLEVVRHQDHMHVSQKKYARELLERANMLNAKSVDTPMISSPTLTSLTGVPLFDAVKRILRYVKGTIDYGLLFQASGLSLSGFSDTDWASSIEDHKSTSGFCIYVGDNLVGWMSKKQSVVSQSTTKVEYRSLANATSEMVCAVSLAANPVLHAKVKHVELDIHFVREKVLSNQRCVNFVPGRDQVADVLTKPLTVGDFSRCRDRLNAVSASCLFSDTGEGMGIRCTLVKLNFGPCDLQLQLFKVLFSPASIPTFQEGTLEVFRPILAGNIWPKHEVEGSLANARVKGCS
ncbi:hypothetical protein CXB51_034278 [Gossypium anomalum]|uniref:Integrase catalytic domain-containing protein n=1 Tax=Gossypium anomalum TaxID=47600 RepID=A0A8J6CJH8_9ROSI|nr:hypothetical protein CXB51_034278 [Gossypium anomalum]